MFSLLSLRCLFAYMTEGIYEKRHVCMILSHDVAPWSDNTPYNKIDKPLVVYRFSNVT